MTTALLTGFLTSFSLILAIGAQNALVLRQGLTRTHVFWVCLFCAVSDSILITAGILGFGAVTAIYPNLPDYMGIAGAIFLLFYAILRVKAAIEGDYNAEITGQPLPLIKTLTRIAAVTWLNPHVYLDTLALIGAISTTFIFSHEKLSFGIGAVFASFTFFFALGYGARVFAPIMQSAEAWRILDCIIAFVMLLIAFGLIWHVVAN